MTSTCDSAKFLEIAVNLLKARVKVGGEEDQMYRFFYANFEWLRY